MALVRPRKFDSISRCHPTRNSYLRLFKRIGFFGDKCTRLLCFFFYGCDLVYCDSITSGPQLAFPEPICSNSRCSSSYSPWLYHRLLGWRNAQQLHYVENEAVDRGEVSLGPHYRLYACWPGSRYTLSRSSIMCSKAGRASPSRRSSSTR